MTIQTKCKFISIILNAVVLFTNCGGGKQMTLSDVAEESVELYTEAKTKSDRDFAEFLGKEREKDRKGALKLFKCIFKAQPDSIYRRGGEVVLEYEGLRVFYRRGTGGDMAMFKYLRNPYFTINSWKGRTWREDYWGPYAMDFWDKESLGGSLNLLLKYKHQRR